MIIKESISISNNISELEGIVNFIENFCITNNVSIKINNTFQIAIDELISNSINYGYPKNKKGKIDVEFILDEISLKAIITDDGQAFDPNDAPKPDIENSDVENKNIGGLGIHLVKKMMTSFEYERKKNKNIITIIKRF